MLRVRINFDFDYLNNYMFIQLFLMSILTLPCLGHSDINEDYSWTKFHDKEHSKIVTDDRNANNAFYKLSNMYCDPRKMHDSKCPDITKLDWIIGIDASWYDKDLQSGRLVYGKMKSMLTSLSEKLKKVANFSQSFYEMGIYLAWADGIRMIKSFCERRKGYSKEPYVAILNVMPSEPALIMKHGESATGMVNMLRYIDHDMRFDCQWERRVPRIIIIMHQYASPGLMSAYQPVFDLLKGWQTDYKTLMANVAFVSVTSSKNGNIFTDKKPHLQQSFPHFGNMFINMLTDPIDEEFLIEYLMNCYCYRHNECIEDDVKVVADCHFEKEYNQTGSYWRELCVKNISQKVNARRMNITDPVPISCLEYVMVDCMIEKCIEDCELKVWGRWSNCTYSFKTRNTTKKRTRLFPAYGHSKFTAEHCLEEEEQLCESTTTEEFEHTTIEQKTTATTEDVYVDETTEDPDVTPLTLPTDIRYTDFNRWLRQVTGLSVFLLICIVGLSILALSLIVIACRQIAKKRREQTMSTTVTGMQRSRLSTSYLSQKSKAAKSARSLSLLGKSQKSLRPATSRSRKSAAAKSMGRNDRRSMSRKSTVEMSRVPIKGVSTSRRATKFGQKQDINAVQASLMSKRQQSRIRSNYRR